MNDDGIERGPVQLASLSPWPPPHGDVYAAMQEVRDLRFGEPVRKVAAWVPVSAELLEDQPAMLGYIEAQLAESLRRQLEPWSYNDRPAIRWSFDPFPRFTRIAAGARRLRELPNQLAVAIVARLDRVTERWRPERDEDDW